MSTDAGTGTSVVCSIVPMLSVRNGARAVEFYKSAFEAIEVCRVCATTVQASAHSYVVTPLRLKRPAARFRDSSPMEAVQVRSTLIPSGRDPARTGDLGTQMYDMGTSRSCGWPESRNCTCEQRPDYFQLELETGRLPPLTGAPAVWESSLSALWGASCPRQGSLLPPRPRFAFCTDLSSGPELSGPGQKRKEGYVTKAHVSYHSRQSEKRSQTLAQGTARKRCSGPQAL